MDVRRSHIRFAVVMAVAAVMVFASAAVAFALPVGDQFLGLTALQQKLDAGPVHGYMKTVVAGARIDTIGVDVDSITSDGLIMFEATGSVIAKIGGIAAGMSGSPIYVDDGGVDKVIGAVSYGNYFTSGGTGLATPIEDMLAIRDNYGPSVASLPAPVLMGSKVFDRVIITSHPQDYAAEAASGAFVARPLAEGFIGGLRPGSKAYEALASALEAKGLTVTRVGAGLSAGASNFTTDLAPGAGIGVLGTRGDMWVGGLGTVTYADGTDVLAFGHSAFWKGATSLYMTNVWINGIWPSLMDPTKIGYPTAIRGTITQDRFYGVMGELGDPPAEAPVTAHARLLDTGQTSDSNVWISSALLDDGTLASSIGPALSTAGYGLFDAQTIPGSASTTATVVVSDGVHQYTVVIHNVYDDSLDIVYASVADAQNAVNSVLSVLANDLENPHVVSVDLDVTYASQRRAAAIAAVDLLEPLHEGANVARVSLLVRGVLATQTVDTTFDVPEGTPLSGQIVAMPSATPAGQGGGSSSNSSGDGSGIEGPPVRPSVADIVDALSKTPSNDEVTVAFVPGSDLPAGGGVASPLALGTTESVAATSATPWVVSGSAATQITQIDAVASTATYGGTTWVTGTIAGPVNPVDVQILYQPFWSPEPIPVETVTAEGLDGELSFEAPIDALPLSCTVIVRVAGGSGYTPAEATVFAGVRAGVRLTADHRSIWRGQTVTLGARVTPHANGGSMTFQYWDAHHKAWRKIATRRFVWTPIVFGPLSLVSGNRPATCVWRAPHGTWKVRAVYSGAPDIGLMGAPSNNVTVKVR